MYDATAAAMLSRGVVTGYAEHTRRFRRVAELYMPLTRVFGESIAYLHCLSISTALASLRKQIERTPGEDKATLVFAQVELDRDSKVLRALALLYQ